MEVLSSDNIQLDPVGKASDMGNEEQEKTFPVALPNLIKHENSDEDAVHNSKEQDHSFVSVSPNSVKTESDMGAEKNCVKVDETSQSVALNHVKTENNTVVTDENCYKATGTSQSESFGVAKGDSIKNNEPAGQENRTTLPEACGVTVKTEPLATASGSEEHDPYFYTKRQDFTSEIFKIEIRNLPHRLGFGQLKKFLNNQMKLDVHKIKPVGGATALQCVYVTFKNEEKRENALKLLHGYQWRGRKLVVKKANPMADPLVKKRSAGDSEDAPAAKKLREDESIPVLIRLKNAVTPLWNVPYEEQLKKKESDMRNILVELGREIEKVNKSFQVLVDENRKAYSFQCCPMSPVKASPCILGYRNKCEFTVGRHLDTHEKVVGFRLSSYKEGSMSVAEPGDCPHVSPGMSKAVKSFQQYIQESDKDVFNPETHAGYWKQLTVRTSRNGDVMIIVVMHPQNLSQSELEKEKKQLTEFFESGPGTSCGVTSAFFQTFSRKQSQNEETNLSHLFGKKFIEEIILGNTFQISPNAFFQVNSDGAEVLYSTIAALVEESKSSAALDICCGTGTIGICVAKQASKVVGIEMVPQAVEDARLNAQINGITNVVFTQGKAEDVTSDVIGELKNSDITAIVDPPRAGLHPKVLKVIRACENVKRLIYVSCNVKAAMTNFVDLCRPPSNNYKGNPFYPVKAIPIDLFPHTRYCELILVFERVSNSAV